MIGVGHNFMFHYLKIKTISPALLIFYMNPPCEFF